MVGASLDKKEETMTLITRAQLAKLSLSELRGLYRKMFNALAASNTGSHERRDVLASLENIKRELNVRLSGP